MSVTKRHANALVTGFFLIIIAVVFQQIATSMTEQGIASGSPYDNAAAYPRAVAVIIGLLLLLQWVISRFSRAPVDDDPGTPIKALVKPGLLLVIFATYLGLLGWLGYHLTTAPMIIAVMWLSGVRHSASLLGVGIGVSLLFAFLFEKFLTIVLPGGVFALNIPW